MSDPASDFHTALAGAPAALYPGTVTHRRIRPRAHAFRYRVFCLLVDLDRLEEAGRLSPLFSIGRFNLASFSPRDHGVEPGADPARAARALLAEAGLAPQGWRVLLMAYPRVLGYVFNPIAVYYAYRPDGALGALIYEVTNTFGQRHAYVAPVEPGERAGAHVRQSRAKRLYVSPFIGMDKTYRFRLDPPGERLALRILETDKDGPELAAAFHGRRTALTTRNLLACCIRVPFLGVKVIGAIHFEAFRLWLKGARIFRKPPPSAPYSLAETRGEPGARERTHPSRSLP